MAGEAQAVTPNIQLILTLGCLLLAAVALDSIGRRADVPRVSLLMLLGLAVSTQGLNLLPLVFVTDWFPILASIALVMVGFLLGEQFTRERMLRYGREVLLISLGDSLVTSAIVIAGLLLFQVPFTVALLLGGIAAATAPAATLDVVQQLGIKGPFSEKLMGVVALDDVWGLMVFSACSLIAILMNGHTESWRVSLIALWELGGAVLLGFALGLPAAYLSGRLEPGQPTLMEALGLVFLCSGLSMWLEVSFLISSMVMGAVVANLASHHERPFHEIEGIEGPFLVLFFILAGATLELESLGAVVYIVAVYVAFRFAGKSLGAYIGARVADSEPGTRRWMGLALAPQAGVAIGMALVAIERFPQYRDILLPTVIASTVIFELVGPFCTRVAIRRTA